MKRLHEFDALRGIAAVAVVLAHLLNYRPAAMGNPFDHWSAPFWSFAANGHFAVLIFFAISGFVLSYPYFIGAKGQRHLMIDTVNRMPRLLIPVFVTGLLCFVIQLMALRIVGTEQLTAFGDPAWITRWNVEGWDIARVVEFLLTRVFLLYSETDTINVNLWTMPVEFAFSLLVFAVGAIVIRRFDVAIFLILISATSIMSWRTDMLDYFLKGLAGSVFFLGVLTAFYWETIRTVIRRRSWMPTVLMIGVDRVVLHRFRVDKETPTKTIPSLLWLSRRNLVRAVSHSRLGSLFCLPSHRVARQLWERLVCAGCCNLSRHFLCVVVLHRSSYRDAYGRRGPPRHR